MKFGALSDTADRDPRDTLARQIPPDPAPPRALRNFSCIQPAIIVAWRREGSDVAYTVGVAFQYFAIAPMRGLKLQAGLVAAVRADTLSLLAFEAGMFAWMAAVQLVLFSPHHLHPSQPAYWFLMQIAMVFGCATAYPANWWLIRHGVKEAM